MKHQKNSLKRLHIALFKEDESKTGVRDKMVGLGFLKPSFESLAEEIGALRVATHVSLRGGIEPRVSKGTALIFKK